MTRIRSTHLAAAASALALALAPSLARADRAEWNQAEMTRIADELRDATRDLWDTFRKDAPSSPGSGQRVAQQRLLDKLKQIENSCKKLAIQLQEGKGRDATFPTFERLMMLVRDAREDARKQMVQQPTIDKITVARDALYQMGPFYEDDWKPPPPVVR